MMRWLKIDWSTFARTLPWYDRYDWAYQYGPVVITGPRFLLDEAEARYRLGDRL